MAKLPKLNPVKVVPRDRSSQGWSLSDFGITRVDNVIRSNANDPSAPLYKGQVAPAPLAATAFASTLTGGSAETAQIIPSTGAGVGPAQAGTANPTSDTVSQMASVTDQSASKYITPEQQAQIKNLVDDPNIVSKTMNVAKDWMSNLFDTTDTEKEALFGIEAPFDAVLGAFNWGYEKINQAGSWANSAAPGGIDTFGWDKAGEISWGQSALAANAAFVNQAKEYGPLGTAAGLAASTIMNPLGSVGGLMATSDSPAAPFAEKGFNVEDAEQRQAAFKDSTVGMWTSGLADTIVTTFADPLIVAGKGAMLARVHYLDRPMSTIEAATALESDATKLFAATNGAVTIEEARKSLSPIGSFVEWVSRVNPVTGEKVVPRTAIYNHHTMKGNANRDAVTTALFQSDGFDQASLVTRYANGDIRAFDELYAVRPDILLGMKVAHNKRLAAIIESNPRAQVKLQTKYQNTYDLFDKEVASIIEQYGHGGDLYETALKQRNQAMENLNFVNNYELPDTFATGIATKEQRDAAKSAWKVSTERDRRFTLAIGSERDRVNNNFYSFQSQDKGFAKDNAFGRIVERDRQRRATAGYQQAVTRKALVATGKMTAPRGGKDGDMSVAQQMRRLHFWETDTFGNNGLTRTARLWRWTGNETPSGTVTTKGVGAIESDREVQAMLNDIDIFSGDPRLITINGESMPAGGTARKEQLMTEYRDASGVQGIAGDEARKYAIDNLERAISNEVALWHGIQRDHMDAIFKQTRDKRDEYSQSIVSEGYWIETGPNGEPIQNNNPYLESHLQNAKLMLNWRAINKAARLYDETKTKQNLDVAGQYATEKFESVYSAFNDVWRPAVLLRLGYTQRNVTEGLFRASALTFSLDPVKYAGVNLAFALRNAAVKRTRAGAIERATIAVREAKGGTVVLPKQYVKWQKKQIIAREKQTSNYEAIALAIEEGVAEQLPDVRASLYKRYEDIANDLNDQMAELIGPDGKAIPGASKKVSALMKDREIANDNLERIHNMRAKVISDTSTQAQLDAAKNLPNLYRLIEDSKEQMTRLHEVESGVAMYRQQAIAKRRVFDGSQIGPDGITLREAFDPENPFGAMALNLLSADTTTRGTLSLNQATLNNLFRAKMTTSYVEVNPGDAGYFDGVARMLRAFQSSEVGKMVIDGATPAEIGTYLRKNKSGREIAAFVTNSQVQKKGNQLWFKIVNVEDAEEYAQHIINRFNQLAPSPDLREFMKTNFLLEDQGMGETVRMFLDQKTPGGTPLYELKGAIGDMEELLATKKVRETWADATNAMFRVLGTIPEDSMVRAPFYGMQYRKARDNMIAALKATPGESVTMQEIDAIQRIAHRRALKDTKKWLYTIDRRTNLGRTGEYMFPFISATQNSVTTVGRIIWNDPSVAAVMLAAWRAPTKLGIEDEQGNISFPIPHSLIPDGLEKLLGIENMTNYKFSKQGLNNIMPESGFGFLPRFGPLLAAPASEIMKVGWFGLTVETPEWLKTATAWAGPEAGDAVWNGWKSYLFGEGQGLAPDFASLSMFQPPVVAKIVQMWQGEGSSNQYASYYNIQMRNEYANWLAGYRDEAPTADEIKQRTNGFYALRILGNLAAFTPPQYESKLDPLIAAIRSNDKKYGLDGGRVSNDQFGNLALLLGDFSNTKNIGGANASASSAGNARKWASLIEKTAPNLGNDLSTLGILVNDDVNWYYDDSAYGWKLANRIPGTTQSWSELQTPEISMRESGKNAGWTAYIKVMDGINAIAEQRGLKSLRSADAADLRAQQAQAIETFRQNPLMAGWYDDYTDFGSTRTTNAVEVFTAALKDEDFMAAHKDSVVWQAASYYIMERQKVLDGLKASGFGINNAKNTQIRDYWDLVRSDLIAQYNGWGTVANRWLNGDDDPTNPSTTFDPTTIEVPVSTDLGTPDALAPSDTTTQGGF